MKLTNIASLDDAITSTGRSGLRNASAADRAMWEEMHEDWERFAVESNRAIAMVEAENVPPDEAFDDDDDQLVGVDRIIVTTSRVGQDFFRAAVLSAYNGRCCITGLSVPSLLVASHIVPWSHDETNRVNPRNGLLLSALHDKAFDNGLLTVDDDMTIQVSRRRAEIDDPYFSESFEPVRRASNQSPGKVQSRPRLSLLPQRAHFPGIRKLVGYTSPSPPAIARVLRELRRL